jgi:hypothetical protein
MASGNSGDTLIVPGIGVCVVQRRLPSGCLAVMDCLGRVWLVGVDLHPPPPPPEKTDKAPRGKGVKDAKRLGSVREGW